MVNPIRCSKFNTSHSLNGYIASGFDRTWQFIIQITKEFFSASISAHKSITLCSCNFCLCFTGLWSILTTIHKEMAINDLQGAEEIGGKIWEVEWIKRWSIWRVQIFSGTSVRTIKFVQEQPPKMDLKRMLTIKSEKYSHGGNILHISGRKLS